jgi:hypothetical protein
MKNKHKIRVLPLAIRNILRGARDPYARLSTIRREVSPALYPALVAWMPNLAQKHRNFVEGRFPVSIQNLSKERRILHPLGPTNEILWSAVVLAHYATRITDFCELRYRFETDLLSGNYEEANSDLTEIQNRFGFSFWLIECRIALLHNWKGLEGQKAFTTSLKDSGASKLVSYIAYSVSKRNEETTNPNRFKAELMEQYSGWTDKEWVAYLQYRIADKIPVSARMIGAVLRMEAVSSVIDQYETFIRLAAHAVTTSNQFAPAYAAALPRLSSVSSDTRLRKLLFLVDPENHAFTDLSLVESDMKDRLLTEDYAGAAKWGDLQRRNIDQLLISAKGYAEAGNDVELPREASLAYKLANLAERMVSKQQEDEASIDVARIALNLRWTSFVNPFIEFAASQITDDPLPGRQRILTSFVYSPALNPSVLFALDNAAKSILARLILPFSTLTCKAELFRANATDDLPPAGISDRIELGLRADRALLLGEFDAALRISRILRNSPRSSTVREALRLEAHTLLKLGNPEEAIVVHPSELDRWGRV